MNTSHRLLLAVSRGRIGWTAGDMPVLELTTIGRKSGLPRSVMLTSPLTESGNLVIVASRGGDDRHPTWFLNLRDEPKVDVVVKGGRRTPMIARIADAEQRSRMWPRIAATYRVYDGYQQRTQREIPLVVLHPTGA